MRARTGRPTGRSSPRCGTRTRCLQFHKYWSPPDTATIPKFLDARDRLGLPIYMGEGGENNLEWLYTAWRLYETHGIGWNFWPWKKIDTRTSPASITPPAGWAAVVEHVAGRSGSFRCAGHLRRTAREHAHRELRVAAGGRAGDHGGCATGDSGVGVRVPGAGPVVLDLVGCAVARRCATRMS